VIIALVVIAVCAFADTTGEAKTSAETYNKAPYVEIKRSPLIFGRRTRRARRSTRRTRRTRRTTTTQPPTTTSQPTTTAQTAQGASASPITGENLIQEFLENMSF